MQTPSDTTRHAYGKISTSSESRCVIHAALVLEEVGSAIFPRGCVIHCHTVGAHVIGQRVAHVCGRFTSVTVGCCWLLLLFWLQLEPAIVQLPYTAIVLWWLTRFITRIVSYHRRVYASESSSYLGSDCLPVSSKAVSTRSCLFEACTMHCCWCRVFMATTVVKNIKEIKIAFQMRNYVDLSMYQVIKYHNISQETPRHVYS